MGTKEERKAAANTRLRNREDTNSLSDNEEYKHKPTKEEEGTEDSEKTKRMSLMTLFAGPTQPTHLDRSLHDLMFAPTSCRSRCGSGSLARRACGGARMDIIEHSDKYELVVDAPGLTPADIHAKLEDGVLSVEGKHEVHEKKEDSGGKVIYSERRRSMMATLHMPMLEEACVSLIDRFRTYSNHVIGRLHETSQHKRPHEMDIVHMRQADTMSHTL